MMACTIPKTHFWSAPSELILSHIILGECLAFLASGSDPLGQLLHGQNRAYVNHDPDYMNVQAEQTCTANVDSTL